MKPSSSCRVAVVAGSSITWRERILRGIASYAHEHGPWHVYTAPEGIEDSLFFSAKDRWDGVIVRVTSERLARRVLALGVPAISIGSTLYTGQRLPRVKVDDLQLAELAVQHLVRGGLRRFAYCSYFERRADEDRGPAFALADRTWIRVPLLSRFFKVVRRGVLAAAPARPGTLAASTPHADRALCLECRCRLSGRRGMSCREGESSRSRRGRVRR